MKNTTGGFPSELFCEQVTKYIHGVLYKFEPLSIERGEGWDRDKLIVTYRIKEPCTKNCPECRCKPEPKELYAESGVGHA